jgi:sugar O-acyltransferase (sialic acid O-acetyltransferase NeuD family)
MIDIVICGASGTALDVLDLIDATNEEGVKFRVVGFLDDAKADTEFAGLPVIGRISDGARMRGVRLVDALGSPRSCNKRPGVIARTGVAAADFQTLVHPSAVVSPRATLGPGCLLFAYTVVGAGASIGSHVTMLAHAVVHHETVVEDWCILCSHASVSGRCRIGRASYLGTGSLVIQDGLVGEGSVVGMGSVVIRPIPAQSVVVGNPARILRSS